MAQLKNSDKNEEVSLKKTLIGVFLALVAMLLQVRE